MSIAVAVRKSGRIVLATDSQTNLGSERVPPENCREQKYMKIGSSYLAATGWTLYSNILLDVLARRRAPPKLDGEKRIFAFFNELWGILHDDYSFVKDQADDSDTPFGSLDSTFLVVGETGLFAVSTDLSVVRYERYFAIGSGAHVAMGAAHALYESDLDAEAIARRSAEAAIAHDIYCGPPLNVVSIAESDRKSSDEESLPSPRRRKSPARRKP